MPIGPVQAGPRSERMSPNRFEATTTSNQSGCCTKCAHRMSMWYLSQRTSGYWLATSATRSSHHGMEMEMPFDLVAAVRRSEEHTSELQSLMRISYAVFCLKKKRKKTYTGKSSIR